MLTRSMRPRTRNFRHNLRTQRYFNERAGIWDRYYAAEGNFHGRVERFVSALTARCSHGGTLLDYGCGTGEIARACASSGWQVTGCDVAPAMLEKARGAHGGETVEWRALETGGARPLRFPSSSFDAVIASSVFEYLGDPSLTSNELARVLAPGGWLLVTVPDMRHPYRKTEEIRRRFLRVPPLRLLLRFTRWRHMADYLECSVNRPGAELWCDLLKAANLRTAEIPVCDDPLLLLAAQKPMAGADATE